MAATSTASSTLSVDVIVVGQPDTEAENQEVREMVSCLTSGDPRWMTTQPEMNDHTDLPSTIVDDTNELWGGELILRRLVARSCAAPREGTLAVDSSAAYWMTPPQ